MLLEVNYSADLGKMLDFFPRFVDHAFELLFLEQPGPPSRWEPLELPAA